MPMVFFSRRQLKTILELIKEDLRYERAKPKEERDYDRIGHLRLLQKFAHSNYQKTKGYGDGASLESIDRKNS